MILLYQRPIVHKRVGHGFRPNHSLLTAGVATTNELQATRVRAARAADAEAGAAGVRSFARPGVAFNADVETCINYVTINRSVKQAYSVR